MTVAEFARKYAPALADLGDQLEEFDAVICGCGAAPQKPDDPDQRPRLMICIDNPWREEQWIWIYSSSHCEWWDDGEEWRLSFADLLNYLRQLPRPLHSFSKFQP